MSSKRILIAGCGKIGLRLAHLLSSDHQVWGLSRTYPYAATQPAETGNTSIHFLTADVSIPETLTGNLPDNIDYLVYCLAPSERTESAYRRVYLDGLNNIISALPGNQPIKRLYFISSTSVYHQNDGQEIDEGSPAQATGFSGKVLLEAESTCRNSIHPSTIIRFSGIYGAQRDYLIRQVKTGQATLSDTVRFSNRIHEDDCVGFIRHLIQQEIHGKPNEALYLASDSQPVDANEVLKFIASRLNITLKYKHNNQSNRRAGSKRCCNKKMLDSGYLLHYPGYQEGYAAMLA